MSEFLDEIVEDAKEVIEMSITPELEPVIKKYTLLGALGGFFLAFILFEVF